MSTLKPESKFVEASGVRVHYLEAGVGQPLVCLHGAGPGASGWSNFRGNLAALASSHRVFLIDLPGFGLSDKPLERVERPLAFNAKVLHAVFDELNLGRLSLVGNSMGGGTAVRYALDEPDRVDKIVLLGNAGAGFGTLCPQPTEGVRAMRAYFQMPSKEAMRALINVFVYDASFVSDALLDERFEASIDPGHLAFMRQRGPLEDLSAELSAVKAPTLLIWGQDDRFVPVEVGLRCLRAFKDAELHVFSQCGHWAQVEQAARFNELVLSFLGRGVGKQT